MSDEAFDRHAVLDCLRRHRRMTAARIAGAVGLALERVYAALVSLEAIGCVDLDATRTRRVWSVA
jgi:DNA-binding IclR family transcriptional regulator